MGLGLGAQLGSYARSGRARRLRAAQCPQDRCRPALLPEPAAPPPFDRAGAALGKTSAMEALARSVLVRVRVRVRVS